MVIAALLVFATLLVAWLLAPTERGTPEQAADPLEAPLAQVA